jgi:hypothetical protein
MDGGALDGCSGGAAAVAVGDADRVGGAEWDGAEDEGTLPDGGVLQSTFVGRVGVPPAGVGASAPGTTADGGAVCWWGGAAGAD